MVVMRDLAANMTLVGASQVLHANFWACCVLVCPSPTGLLDNDAVHSAWQRHTAAVTASQSQALRAASGSKVSGNP